ncbi:NAD-dependent epimerase/dehydratase family protein [Zhouia amylolytica]|uniref:NAD-dependent epimerase/dehydratase family protein n=1 Tax=Zhouia amylolytica TaxID=376730 RepID=UPI0030B91AB5
MRILITGATGLIGQEIVRKCRDRKIAVNYLTTDKSKIKSEENYKGFYWNTNELEIDKSCFNEVEAIINLAGSNIAKRWTKSYKDEIISSRINSLRTLRKGLAESNKTVKSIVSSSAIGIYPDSYVKYYQEDETEIDDSFLGVVVEKWEDTAKELDSFTEDLAII